MKIQILAAAIACSMAVSSALAQPGPAGGFPARVQTARPGPPAPVPPQVAIPRPTSDEIAKLNNDLAQFIAASPDKDLLNKWAPLLTVQMPRPNTAIAPVQTQVRNNQRHAKFVQLATNSDFDILFEGDSITDWWQQGGAQGGADVFKKHFAGEKVANFAVAGDTTQGVLWGLENGEGQGHKPKAIMLMIGTNNSGGNSGPEIAEGVGAVILELRRDFPKAKILLLAIFPRGAGPTDPLRVKNEEANKLIARLADGRHVFFMNINDKFLDPQGALIGFRNDNLHPNAEGYEIWASAVAPTLKRWID